MTYKEFQNKTIISLVGRSTIIHYSDGTRKCEYKIDSDDVTEARKIAYQMHISGLGVNYMSKVEEFHNLFEMPVLPKPTIPLDRWRLRVALIQEELNELIHAVEAYDIVEVADALVDLQYVLSGAVLEFGMASKFDQMFNEVHRSNMSKACSSIDEAQMTVEHYLNERSTHSKIHKKDGLFIVKREKDGKALKSINYSPAELKPILNS